jgi:hypothetical protein
MKIRQVAAELFHADVRTDMTQQTVAVRNFADAPKIRERIRFLSTTLLLPDTRCSCNHGASKNPYMLQIFRLIKIKILFGFLHRMVELRPKYVEG